MELLDSPESAEESGKVWRVGKVWRAGCVPRGWGLHRNGRCLTFVHVQTFKYAADKIRLPSGFNPKVTGSP